MLIHKLVYKRIDSGEAGIRLLNRGWRLIQKLSDPRSRVAVKPLTLLKAGRKTGGGSKKLQVGCGND